MPQTVVIISLFLFIAVNTDASAVFDPLKYQALVSTRFQEMDTVLRHQAEQLKELSERIKNLEGVVDNQKTEIQSQNKQVKNRRNEINSLTNILENRLNQVQSLQNTIDNQTIQINKLTDQLSIVKLKQLTDDTRISGLEKATIKEKTGLNKSDYHLNIESRDSEVQMIEDGRKPPLPLSVMDSKVRRHLIGPAAVASMIQPTAFYAYLSHHELGISNHYTLIYDTVITNMNSAYSKFTGVFTVPVGGIYGFTYNVRMGCHTSIAAGPFEIIKNDVAEGVVFIDDHACSNQVTVTRTVIIHANLGDKVYIRTHPTFPLYDGNVYSDINGRTSFAGWLITSSE